MPGAPFPSVNFAGMNLRQASFGLPFPELSTSVTGNRTSQVSGLASFVSMLDWAVEMMLPAAVTQPELLQDAGKPGPSKPSGAAELSNAGPMPTPLANPWNGRAKVKTTGTPSTALMQMDGGLPGPIAAAVPIPQFDSQQGKAQGETALSQKLATTSESQLPGLRVVRTEPQGSPVSAAPIAFVLQLRTKSPAPAPIDAPAEAGPTKPTPTPLPRRIPIEQDSSSNLEKPVILERPVIPEKPVINVEPRHRATSMPAEIIAEWTSLASSVPSASNALASNVDVEPTRLAARAAFSQSTGPVTPVEACSISHTTATAYQAAPEMGDRLPVHGTDTDRPSSTRLFYGPPQAGSRWPGSGAASRGPDSTSLVADGSPPVSSAPPPVREQTPLDWERNAPNLVRSPGASLAIRAGDGARRVPATADRFVSSPAMRNEPPAGQPGDEARALRFPSSSDFSGEEGIPGKSREAESPSDRNGAQGPRFAAAGQPTTSDACSLTPSEPKESHTSPRADSNAASTPRTEKVDPLQALPSMATQAVRPSPQPPPKNTDTPPAESPRKSAMPRRNESPSEPIEPATRAAGPAPQGVAAETAGSSRADLDYGAEDARPPEPAPAVEEIHSEPALNSLPRNGISRQISLKIAGPDSTNIAVQLKEHAGKIQIAVRSGDPQLNRSLQSDLGTLVNRLENQGFKTEAWVPAARHGAVAQAGLESTPSQAEPDHSGFADPGQQRHESSHRNPRRRPPETIQFVQAISDEDARTEGQ